MSQMMIIGKLISQPQEIVNKSGNHYAHAMLAIDTENGTLWASLSTSGLNAENLLSQPIGKLLKVIGDTFPVVYESEDMFIGAIGVAANEILTPKHTPKPGKRQSRETTKQNTPPLTAKLSFTRGRYD